MSTSEQYPVRSDNLHKKNLQFWNDLGIPVDRIQQVDRFSDRLYSAPVRPKAVNDFLVNDYTNTGLSEAEGEIGLNAARKILGDQVSPGEDITVRMFEYQSWPEEVYDATLEVVDESEVKQDAAEEYRKGCVEMINEETPPEFEYGGYDFVVFNDQNEAVVADPEFEFDLKDWR